LLHSVSLSVREWLWRFPLRTCLQALRPRMAGIWSKSRCRRITYCAALEQWDLCAKRALGCAFLVLSDSLLVAVGSPGRAGNEGLKIIRAERVENSSGGMLFLDRDEQMEISE
jgi:hypothetical protein